MVHVALCCYEKFSCHRMDRCEKETKGKYNSGMSCSEQQTEIYNCDDNGARLSSMEA